MSVRWWQSEEQKYWQRKARSRREEIHAIIDRLEPDTALYWQCVECLDPSVKDEPMFVGGEVRFFPKLTPENTVPMRFW